MNAALHLARIGPNAITQLTGALERQVGARPARELLHALGFARYLDAPPRDMVAELEVIGLHDAVRRRLPRGTFHGIATAAGEGTADYLLAHRIPRSVQGLLHRLPKAFAARVLLAAIRRHAWTFVGSGRCRVDAGPPVAIVIEGCALCCGLHEVEPQCAYYAATFGRLFAVLVDARSRVRETRCIAGGAAACRFEIDWRG